MQTWLAIDGVNVKNEGDALLMRGLLEMLGVLPYVETACGEFEDSSHATPNFA